MRCVVFVLATLTLVGCQDAMQPAQPTTSLPLAQGGSGSYEIVDLGTLDQTNGGQSVPVLDGAFRHPIDLGDLSNMSCSACHRYNRAFQHPVKLGDLSQFKCADCHAGKNWTLEGY